jgi:hypothetical protein
MTNATSRANARTLPEATNRRAVLRGVLAAGAVGATLALPAVAAASIAPSHPDAELFALIERARTADAVSTEACMAAADLLHETRPSFPQALIWAEADAPHWHGVRPGQRIPDFDIDFLRPWLKLDKKPGPTVAGIVLVYPTLEFVERAREIVQTKDEYEAAEQAAREHPDVLEAEARDEVLTKRWRELAMRVATTPAKTPEGLLAKFTLIASGYAEGDLDGTYDGILASAAVDAQSLANVRFGEARS